MDLLDLMTEGANPQEKALNRLAGIIELYESADEEVQDEALARAITFSGKEWGSYKAGLQALARRHEDLSNDELDNLLAAMRLREESDEPGFLIRLARQRLAEAGRMTDERMAVIARYGSEDAAIGPTPLERLFVEAAEHLSDPDEHGNIDPWSPLAGWALAWHDLPPALREAVSAAVELPASILDARDEALSWEARQQELAVLNDGPGQAVLPTACGARHRIVIDLWRRDLPARSSDELEARLEYWATRGGDDRAGYDVVLADLRRLALDGGLRAAGEGTKEKVKRLKADNPDWSLARIGKALSISRQAVHKHLKA
jgi:hypothetical protein